MSFDRGTVRFAALILALALANARELVGQVIQTGPQVVTFFSDVDDSDQPYGLYVPKNFDPAKTYPLVVSLHGAGSNHRLNLRRVFGKSNQAGETDVEATRWFPGLRDVDFIVACPLARGTMGYQGIAEKDVLDVLADVKKRFRIDDDRVYLTGLSMGGGGTLWLGLTRPDVWAGIAPVCPAPPDGAFELAGNALNVPVRFFQGRSDPVVKLEGTREWTKSLKNLGAKVESTEYWWIGHESWEYAYKDGAIFDWFARFRRNRYPDRVRFSTRYYKYPSAYWIRIDALTPCSLATINACFSAPNHLNVTTTELGGFTLMLEGHPKFSAIDPLILTIDGKVIEANVADSLSLSRRDGAWVPVPADRLGLAKRQGAEGPLAEAVASRHVYVYGTADQPTSAELTRRREQAAHAADWTLKADRSLPLGSFFEQIRPPLVSLRVLADKEVRSSDLATANLILFGTKETNSIIARFSHRLPMELSGTASGYGLVYIFPVGPRYVLVNSGLPWWTSKGGIPPLGVVSQSGQRPRYRFLNWPSSLLSELKDFLVFKGSSETVIADGFFDAHWQLPAGASKTLKDTGVIVVKERSIANVAVATVVDEISGTWKLKYTTPIGQTDEPVLVISREGDQLKGKYTSGKESFDVTNLRFKDGELTFQISGKNSGSLFNLTYEGKPRGGLIEGRIKYEYKQFTGYFKFEGKRSAPMEKE